MAGVSIEPPAQGDRTAEWRDDQGATYTDVYRVRMDSATDSQAAVLLYFIANQADLYDPHPDDAYTTVRNIRVKKGDDSPFTWFVEVEYSTETLDPAKQAIDPRDRPAEVTIGWEDASYYAETDADGELVGNSAYDPFTSLMQVPLRVTVLTVTKNFSSVDAEEIRLSYADRVNSEEFYGNPPGTVLLDGVPEVTERYWAGVNYVETIWKFKVKRILDTGYVWDGDSWELETDFESGWLEGRVDRGYRYLDGAEYKIFKDSSGIPYPEGQLLDGAGEPLPDGDPPVYFFFRKYEEADLNDLQLFT